jgi:hypothetical protein
MTAVFLESRRQLSLILSPKFNAFTICHDADLMCIDSSSEPDAHNSQRCIKMIIT